MAITWISTGAVNAAASGNPAVAVPTNIQGDILICAGAYFSGSGATLTAPAGWTLIDGGNTANSHLPVAAWYKISNGSEPGTYTWTAGGSPFYAMAIVCYRGVDANNPIDDHNNQSSASTTAPTAPSINANTASDVLLTLLTCNNVTNLAGPGGQNQRVLKQWASGTNDALYFGDQNLTASGATGTRAGSCSITGASGTAITLRPTLPPTQTSVPAQAPQIITNFSQSRVLLLPSTGGFQSSVVSPQGYPTSPAPNVPAIVVNFAMQPLRPQGFKNARFFSVPLAFPTPPAPNIPAILANFSMRPLRPQGFAVGWNSSVPLAFPTPPAPNVRAILSNFSPPFRQPQGFGTGFSSSVPLAFPTPPAPNIPAIYRNFAPPFIQPQGYIQAWNFSIPQGFPTPPPPPIAAIVRNFSPPFVRPQGFWQDWNSSIIISPIPPSPNAVPIARILANNSPWFVLQGMRSAHGSSAPLIIPPPPSITPPPPIRQIVINNSPYLVLPVFGAGILGAIVPPPVPGGLHAAFTLILADSFKTYLLTAAAEAGMAILADDMVITLKSCAAAQKVSLQVAESAQRITLESSI